jgi:uncharacterized protein YbjT (DUF2867 family)
MYLITGAGGGVGSVSRRVVELLLDDGEPVRALVRRDDERADRWARRSSSEISRTPATSSTRWTVPAGCFST